MILEKALRFEWSAVSKCGARKGVKMGVKTSPENNHYP